MRGRGKLDWAPLLSPSRSFSEAMAGFHLLGCSVLLLLLSKRLDCSLEAKGDGRACYGLSGLCGDRNWLPRCHPPRCSCFPISATGDLGLGLWSMVTFLAFSSYLGCLHPSIFCRIETMGLVSAGTWRGWCVPSLLPIGQPSAQRHVKPIKCWLRLDRGDWSPCRAL